MHHRPRIIPLTYVFRSEPLLALDMYARRGVPRARSATPQSAEQPVEVHDAEHHLILR
jgi:hypothetical protein